MRKYLWLILCLVVAFFMSLDKFILYQNIGNYIYPRIDIKWQDTRQKLSVTDSNISFYNPSWRNDAIIGEKDLNKKSSIKTINVKIKAARNDKLSIALMGKHVKYEKCKKCLNGVIPVLVKYKDFTVNEKTVFSDTITVHRNHPYVYSIDVKAGQIIDFSVQVEKAGIFGLLKYCLFNIWAFLCWCIIFVLAYYLIKKLSVDTRKIDTVFIIMFFVLLFLPMSRITTSTMSKTENRNLAVMPDLIVKGKINGKYGQQFDAWFNDRFNGRQQLLDMYTRIKFYIEKYVKNDKMIMAPDGYIFDKSKLKKLNEKINTSVLTDNLKKLKKFCDRHNIKLFFMFVPVKEDVLSEKLKALYYNQDKYRFHADVADLFAQANISFVDPYDIFMKNPNKEDLFFQTDHHWTEYGTFIAYQQLGNKMKIKTVPEKDWVVFYNNKPRSGSFIGLFNRPFYIGSNCNSLSLKKGLCPDTKEYRYFDHKQKDKLSVKNGPMQMSRITHFNQALNSGNLTILGTSSGGFLMQFLAYTFTNVQMLRVNNEEKLTCSVWDMSRFEKHILNFRTNVLLVYLCEQDLLAIRAFYK